MWWQTLLGITAGVLQIYLALLGLLWHTYRRHANAPLLRESLCLLPDLFRLLRRLAADPNRGSCSRYRDVFARRCLTLI